MNLPINIGNNGCISHDVKPDVGSFMASFEAKVIDPGKWKRLFKDAGDFVKMK